jgi:hypothetical protein
VRVGLVMLDSEHFRTQPQGNASSMKWNAAITDKHTAIFNITKSVFPATEVSWFGRGGCHRGPLPEAIDGWWCGEGPDNFFTLTEPADAFSVTQYTLWEPGYRREAFRRTVEAVSIAAAAGAPPLRPLLHTYISLGAGLRRSVLDFKAGVSTGRAYATALPCPALPCPALPCPALPCPALPCPALPCPALPLVCSALLTPACLSGCPA